MIILKYTAILITIQLLVLILAFKKSSNIDEFMAENGRTRMRKNNVHRGGLNNDGSDVGIPYATELVDLNTNKEELPAVILHNANDILLDNSVETRKRKRENSKVEKYNQAEIKATSCSCEQEIKKSIILGDDYFPTAIETRSCDKNLCTFPYGCKELYYNLTVLKRKSYEYVDETSQQVIPDEIQKVLPTWIAIKIPVIIGCICVIHY